MYCTTIKKGESVSLFSQSNYLRCHKTYNTYSELYYVASGVIFKYCLQLYVYEYVPHIDVFSSVQSSKVHANNIMKKNELHERGKENESQIAVSCLQQNAIFLQFFFEF